MRWLHDTWTDCVDLRERGVDVRAVTVWAALGTYDWDSCVVRESRHYEPGAFDMRGGLPRPTAIAALVRELASGRPPSHPALSGPRWWRSPDRLTFGRARARPDEFQGRQPLPIGALGSHARLGRGFIEPCSSPGCTPAALARRDVDLGDAAAVPGPPDRVLPLR